MALAEPQIFGKYHLVDKIATGGMAEVFRAKSYGVAGFEKTLVIKKILPNLASDKKFVEMFIDEAKIASTLSHINVVQIFDLGSEDGDYFIAMEYVDGTDLKTLVEKARQARRPVPVNLMAYVASEVAKGLDYAHRRKDTQRRDMNIVHRDISPHNVLVSHAGEVKITDFGIARASSKVNITRSGVIRGKFAYMSPEQARGDAIDRRSDIFSLGIVIYELASGRHPFRTGTSAATVASILEDPPTPLVAQLPEHDLTQLGRGLERVLLTALQKEPDARFQTAAELADALARAITPAAAGPARVGTDTSTARWWWQFHQATTSAAYLLLLMPLRQTRAAWGSGDLGMFVFLVGVVAVIVAGALRLHLWFAARHYLHSWEEQHVLSRHWIRGADLLFSLVLLSAGIAAIRAEAPAVLMVASAAAVAVSSTIIEPATTRAAFSRPYGSR